MTERRHRQRAVRCQASRTADNDLRHVRSARIVYRGAPGQRRKWTAQGRSRRVVNSDRVGRRLPTEPCL
jgi:hypothetical protein